MDIKDYINLFTKVNKNEGMNNVKWFKVPKDNKSSGRYQNKPLPYYMELERSLHVPNKKHGKGKKHKKKDQVEDEKFQVLEIRQSIKEVSVGWNAILSLEKRYKESQKRYAFMDNNSSESNDSFTTAHTTTITETDDSFSSAIEDFEHLKISDEFDKNTQSEVSHGTCQKKEPYKRNALIKGIIQNKKNICSLTPTNSIRTPDLLIKPPGAKKNLHRNENKQNLHEKKGLKHAQKKGTSKTCKSIKNDPKEENHQVSKAVTVADTSRKHFMEVSDDCFSEFVPTKSMKNSKKTMKQCVHEF